MLKRARTPQLYPQRVTAFAKSNFGANRSGRMQWKRAGAMGSDRVEQGNNDWLPVKPAFQIPELT